jgi:hypothetical protein
LYAEEVKDSNGAPDFQNDKIGKTAILYSKNGLPKLQ